MVDWKGLRTKSGMTKLSKQVVDPSSSNDATSFPITPNPTAGGAKRSGEITGLAGADYNPGYSRRMRDMLAAKRPRLQKPYDGTDEVGGAIHVNPTRNETPIKGADEVGRIAPEVTTPRKSVSKFTVEDIDKALRDPEQFLSVKEEINTTLSDVSRRLKNKNLSNNERFDLTQLQARLRLMKKHFDKAPVPTRVDDMG